MRFPFRRKHGWSVHLTDAGESVSLNTYPVQIPTDEEAVREIVRDELRRNAWAASRSLPGEGGSIAR